MMNYRTATFRGLAVFAGALALGCAPNLHRSIDPVARVVQGGREVKVSVTQSEIKADIQPATGGQAFGLIGALVDVGVNNSRAAEAEKTVQVVRESLSGFDFDGLALKDTKETLTKLDWFGVKDVSFGKEFTPAKRMEELDGAKAPQVMYTDYNYSLAPDFSSIKVVMVATLATKEISPNTFPNERLDADKLSYIQQFIVVMPLSAPSKEATENAKRWAGDGGKLARTGLETGLATIQRLFEQSLTQAPDALKAVDTAEMVSLGGYTGRLVAKTDDGTLMRLPSGFWVFVNAKEM